MMFGFTWTKPARKQWGCRTGDEEARQAAGKPSPKQKEHEKMRNNEVRFIIT